MPTEAARPTCARAGRALECSEIAPGVWIVRFLAAPAAVGDEFPPFDGVCTVLVDGAHGEIHGMLGRLNRRRLRALLTWLVGVGVTDVRARRDPAHTLPGGEPRGDWTVISLARLGERL